MYRKIDCKKKKFCPSLADTTAGRYRRENEFPTGRDVAYFSPGAYIFGRLEFHRRPRRGFNNRMHILRLPNIRHILFSLIRYLRLTRSGLTFNTRFLPTFLFFFTARRRPNVSPNPWRGAGFVSDDPYERAAIGPGTIRRAEKFWESYFLSKRQWTLQVASTDTAKPTV